MVIRHVQMSNYLSVPYVCVQIQLDSIVRVAALEVTVSLCSSDCVHVEHQFTTSQPMLPHHIEGGPCMYIRKCLTPNLDGTLNLYSLH